MSAAARVAADTAARLGSYAREVADVPDGASRYARFCGAVSGLIYLPDAELAAAVRLLVREVKAADERRHEERRMAVGL